MKGRLGLMLGALLAVPVAGARGLCAVGRAAAAGDAQARSASDGTGLQAGAASVDITPPVGHPLWGYAARHDAPCTGIHDRLRARVLVLAAGTERLALVSLDLGRAPTRASMATLRARALKEAGVGHLFVVASHTHHGPVLELDDWPTPKTSYVRELETKLGDAIAAAAKALRPARLGAAGKEVAFNRNRQSKRDDRPVDRQLLVLRIEDAGGKPIAHAVNFAAHPTMHPAEMLEFSADYPGALAALVEKETGAPCLFLQGASGDLSTDRGALPGPREFGEAVGREALALAGTIRCRTLAETALKVREEDFTFQPRIDLSNPIVRAVLGKAFFPELIGFYEREYRDGVRPRLSVAVLDGRLGLVGVSGEFFCGHALSLKRRARLEHLFFLGCCNDYQQYFPTIEAASEGGYGTSPPVSSAELGAGERMMDRALLHLYAMRGQLPAPLPSPAGKR
jgi:neutral ceramidase